MKAFTTKELIELTIAVVHPIVGAILGGIILSESVDPWYHQLNQPTWVPPEWSYTPIWTIVYCCIGFAAYIAYRKVVASASGWDIFARVALFLYIIHLIFNWACTPIFLGLQSLKWNFINLVAWTVSAAACSVAFYLIHRLSGGIFVLYVLWLIYTTSAAYELWELNP